MIKLAHNQQGLEPPELLEGTSSQRMLSLTSTMIITQVAPPQAGCVVVL